ncbi:MAG TPA: LamG-like jellyroll fold domain-containing protein [Verrucomicrobiae bacterium]|jgi:hypothetical protein
MLIAFRPGSAPGAVLVNQWKFENNLNDTSGNNNNGTLVGAGSSYVPGVFGGQGIYLATNEMITNLSAAGLPLAGNSDWSMNVWLYLTNNPVSLAYFAGFGGVAGSSGTTRGLIAFGAPANLGIYLWGDNTDFASGAAYPLNQWVMVTATHSGATGITTFYTNSVTYTNRSQVLAAIPATAKQIQINYPVFGAGDRFNGIMDEFTIWSGVLTANDVAGLYASNSPPFLPPIVATPPNPVTAYAGEYAGMTVTPGNIGPDTYQWLQNGVPLAGQTNASIYFTPLAASNTGLYMVIISNAYGSVTSSPATTVTVLPVANITTALAAYWNFDEPNGLGVTDVTTNGNNGQMFGFVGDGSERVPGKVGPYALHFRGVTPGDYIEVTNCNIRPPATMTIAGWVYVDAISQWATIIKQWPPVSANTNDEVHFGANNATGELSCYVGTATSAQVGPVVESTVMPLGQWIHVAFTADGTNMNIYRNGALNAPPFPYGGTLSTNIFTNISGINRTMGIGVKLTTNGVPFPIGQNPGWWQGSMDDLAVWTRALTPAEILSIYVAGAEGQPMTNADAFVSTVLPIITDQPRPISRYQGEYRAQFAVAAAGKGTVYYQWTTNGIAVPGGTSNVLTLAGPFTSAGIVSVQVTVSNAGTTNVITSLPTSLTILPVTSIANGLSGYWKFDETEGYTAFDSTTNSRDAALISYYSDPSQWVAGEISNSLSFDGGSQFLWVNNYVEPTNNTMSLSAWVYASSQNSFGSIADTYGQDPIGQFRFGLTTLATHELTGGIISQGDLFTSTADVVPFPSNSWQHVAMVADGSSIRLYRNGLLVSSTNYPGTILSVSGVSNMLVGARIADDGSDNDINSTPGYWGGMIDDLGMWTRGLTPAEIHEIYLSGSAGQSLNQAIEPAGPLAPYVSLQPVNATVLAGQSASFAAAGNDYGTGPINYQWQKEVNGSFVNITDGGDYSGTTNATLSISNSYFTDAGTYQVIVSNGAGGTNSTGAVLAVLPPPTYANATNGLILHLKFDGDYNDSSGQGNNGAAQNSPTGTPPTMIAGRIGSGAVHVASVVSTTNFSYVTVPDSGEISSALQTAGPGFSVSFWVRYTGIVNDLPMIGNATGSTYQKGFVFTDDGGKIEWTLVGTDTGSVIADPLPGSPTTANSVWHNVVAAFDRGASVANTWVDGNLIDTRSIAGMGNLDTGSPLFLGQDPTGLYKISASFDIDDVGIWNRPLTPYEAISIYGAGARNQSFDEVGPVLVTVKPDGHNIDLSWQSGTLQSASSLSGPWTTITNAVSPFFQAAPTNSQQFYRVQVQ